VLAVLDLVAYGKTVVLDHGGQIATVYAHLSRVSVQAGDVVEKGQALGSVGSTGLSTGVHLHFELRVNAAAKDPATYLNLPDPAYSAE
jgi:murein DD-endopeptidase MepM/ murein hydrolase activator NlpD